MPKLFDEDDDADDEPEIKINEKYAANYDKWRLKEEVNRLKTKHGDHLKYAGDSEESSSSSDDEDANLLTEEMDKNFYKTLAYLKKKDPKIYDDKVVFFPPENNDAGEGSGQVEKKKKKKEKPLSLRDYERKILIEKGGKLSDDSDEDHQEPVASRLTYVEEQRLLKESIKKAADIDDDDGDDDLLKEKTKASEEKEKEEEAYRLWLLGQPAEVDDKDEEELKPLRDFWTDPNLDANEKFLRDFVMRRKFSDEDNQVDDSDGENNNDYANRLHDSDKDLSEDEKQIETQEEFEHKYNFRFEEPDPEFIKRYPRTIEDSMRKKDTRRAEKRAEVKKRKEQEKLRQKEELKRYKMLKRKEIMDKIAQLKEITGNDDLKVDILDFEGDFDPSEHDRKMQELFNDEYYQDVDENAKPEFPELDEELEIEKTWDDYDPTADKADLSQSYSEPHCEDSNFVMDADYEVNKKAKEAEESSSKRKRRKRSKFAELIAKEKPKFDPILHSSFKDYIDQYYALDYEDMIGDQPCRFKYRKVVPNDYGLTVEEILLADDKELNKWCSLKKALEHKSEDAEYREVQTYKQKSKDERFKRKILSSLYKPIEEEVDDEVKKASAELNGDANAGLGAEKKKKRRKKKSGSAGNQIGERESKVSEDQGAEDEKGVEKKKKKKSEVDGNVGGEEVEAADKQTVAVTNGKKKKKSKVEGNVEGEEVEAADKQMAAVTNEKKKKKKKEVDTDDAAETNETKVSEEIKQVGKNKRKGESLINGESEVKAPHAKKFKFDKSNKDLVNKSTNKVQKMKNKNKQPSQPHNPIASLSNERLKAYGLNPRKFRNKLKFGKQNNEKN
ncbi:protein KRI1 homolog [Microplitis demolitor]|uniref:protein KRI1 homolog n=1 Tax=Microplitis demolitor TaxID=69319 RepID=UPI0004CD58C7|nr:protein KRI1 homolog [Microplitis demolitor]